MPVKFDAEVIAARPGICTWPGESRLGMVSLRLSCAVNPLAAQAATPSEPLPSGSDCVVGGVRLAEDDVGPRDDAAGVLREGAVLPGGGDGGGSRPGGTANHGDDPG